MKMIDDLLRKLAVEKEIELLYACETGSRAWGFPSPDSDYDVRCIYRHKKEWYLSLSEHKDHLEKMDGDLDVTGWDLRKCLRLVKRSNVPLIERFQSPIVYFEAENFSDDFKELLREYYSPVAVFFHHYSLAKKCWIDIKDEPEIKLKSYFYMVRSLLSCNWILHDDSVLPMQLVPLMKYLSDEKVEDEINRLVLLKSSVNEQFRLSINAIDVSWVAKMFVHLETSKQNLKANDRDMKMLNDYFLKTVL